MSNFRARVIPSLVAICTLGLIFSASSRAEVAPPPALGIAVNHPPIAHPVFQGLPVLKPFMGRSASATNARTPQSPPSVAVGPKQNLALSAGAQSSGCASGSNQPAPLVALASSLKCDADLIFEYVYNNIEFEPLYGSNKGPLGTLLDRRGDDADQAILLVTLLNIAGYSQTGYVNLPTFLSGFEISNWLGVRNDAAAIEGLLAVAGIPFGNASVNQDGTLASIGILHFVASLQLNGVWYYFDPSLKPHTILSGIPGLASALGYNRTQFLSDVGGTIDNVSISNVNRDKLRADLVGYAANLVSYINQNDRTWSVGNVIGGKSILPLQGSPVRIQIPSITPSPTFPANCPNQTTSLECRTFVVITMPGASSSQSIKLYTDQVYGHRITVFSTPSGSNFIPTLLIDGAAPACVAAGSCTNVGPATAAGVTWSIPMQVVEPNQRVDQSCPSGTTATTCATLTVAAGASYLVGLGAGRVERGMVDYHRQLLAQARAAGNSDSSELVLGESLAVISDGWLAESSAIQNIFDHLTNVTTLYNFAAGITGQAKIQQSGFQGPYVDLPVNFLNIAPQSSNGPTTIVGGVSYPTALVSTFFPLTQASSSFEAAILEQTQAPSGMTAASTIKIIDSNMNPTYPGSLGRTFLADGTTAAGQSAYNSTIKPAISSQYDASDLSAITSAVQNGSQVLIPANGKLAVGLWSGAGWTETLARSLLDVTQKISGGMSGGFSGTDDEDTSGNTEETFPTVANSDTSDPFINTIPAPSNPSIAEPVDGVTGAYVYKNTDIVTGSGKFPYALDFSRAYLSSSGSFLTSTASDIGMGNGWTHNWSSNVQVQSDPYLGIGVDNSSAISAATSIAALYVMQDLMSVTPTAQTSTLSSMVARWFTDQLTGNVAIVTQPDTTEAFVALPHIDGSASIAFNAPPGSSARLNQIATGQFSYMRKDGVVANFGPTPSGALQSIVYPNGMTVNLSYSGSPLVLNSIANNLGRSLTLSYNGTHVSSVTDDTGRSVAYAYDGHNNLVNCSDPVGAVTTYAYDTSGTYDTAAHLTQVFYPAFAANAFVTNWYDPLGRVAKQASANGAVTNFYFAGSRSETIDPLQNRHVTYQTDRGPVVMDAYVLSNSFGDVFNDTIQQNGLINITRNQYDGLDRLTATVLPEGGSTSYFYATNLNPWANNISTVIKTPKPGSPGSLTTTFTYDPFFNQPTSTTDPLGLITSMSYDLSGNLRASISDFGSAPHLNATTRSTYNNVGQVLTTTDPLGVVTQYTYDSRGNQTSITRDVGTGHLNRLTSYGYSAQGDVAFVTDPRGNITSKTYDAARRLTSTTAPNGLVTANSYDLNGQLIQAQQSANGTILRTTGTTYTLTGKPAVVTDANGNNTSTAYDPLDRVASVTDAVGRVTSYGYDAMGRQISISNAAIQSAPLLQKAYTPDGLLTSITDANNHTTSLAYDGFDRLATTTYPLGSTEALTYDADNNILTRKTRAGGTITFTYDTLNRLSTKTPPAPAPVVSYGYDLAGRLTSVGDSSAAIPAAMPPSGSSVQYAATYTYDVMNRPIGVNWSPAPATAVPSFGSVTINHGYNKTNQRVGQSLSDNSWLNYPAATPSVVSYTSNALNQYTAVGAVSPTYDGNGNLASDGTFTFGFDPENRLNSASGAGNTAAYAFDAQGRRKTKTVNGATTVFVTDADNREVLEYDGTSGAIQRWYAYALGPNDVLSQMNVTAGTRAMLLPDIQGSIIASLDSVSGTTAKIGYLPYGKSPSPGPFGYTGQRIDLETNGLYYYRGRHYSPLIGRFLQTDPSGTKGGVNLYTYAKNDPLNLADSTGLSPDGPVDTPIWVPDPEGGLALADLANRNPKAAMAGAAAGAAAVAGIGFGAWALAGAAEGAESIIPTTLARAIPNGIPLRTLGPPGAADVFVTTPEAIEGLDSAGIAQRLTIPESPTGFQVLRFSTPEEGLASPVFRPDPGFVGGGRTAGGAPEFVIPNGPIPPDATITMVP